MYNEPLTAIKENALTQLKRMEESLPRYIVSSSLAGAYIGLAIVLIMIIGGQLSQASSPYTIIIMGASFGLALTLVIFAGADLFTGNNMFFTISTLAGVTSVKDTLKIWFWCYIGNFLGAFALCLVVIGAGIFSDISPEHTLMKLASKKMNLSSTELFFRGILCNWTVCLAIWMGIRTKSDPAKILVIYACLFTFIVSGYEHSIANMTVLTLSVLLPHPETISIEGMIHNLIPVTFGNILGGGILVGMVYTFINTEKRKKTMEERQQVKAS
jgi:nitrite transporter